MVPRAAALALLAILGSALPAAPPPAPAGRDWGRVKSWVYQLQKLDLATLAKVPVDLVVIDYSRTGRAAGEWQADEIRRLRASGKLVVSYMSIGEAEPYRFYWQKGWRPGTPSWLLTANPDWPDNFPVQYWHPDWQGLLLGSPGAYLDRILAAGFDGVYLDIVDGYEQFQEERPAAAQEMRDLVTRLAAYARARAGADFGVFAQNALDLLDDRTYRGVLTGLGKEETWFFPGDKPSPRSDQRFDEGHLDRLVKEGKLVLTVDYCRKPANVAKVRERATGRGYVPYMAKVELDGIYDHGP